MTKYFENYLLEMKIKKYPFEKKHKNIHDFLYLCSVEKEHRKTFIDYLSENEKRKYFFENDSGVYKLEYTLLERGIWVIVEKRGKRDNT